MEIPVLNSEQLEKLTMNQILEKAIEKAEMLNYKAAISIMKREPLELIIDDLKTFLLYERMAESNFIMAMLT